MKRMSQEDIGYLAKGKFNSWIAGYGLENSLRLVLSLRRLLLDEKNRRKNIKS